jgi:hypothetical protein
MNCTKLQQVSEVVLYLVYGIDSIFSTTYQKEEKTESYVTMVIRCTSFTFESRCCM